jgi:hypothetical protein
MNHQGIIIFRITHKNKQNDFLPHCVIEVDWGRNYGIAVQASVNSFGTFHCSAL